MKGEEKVENREYLRMFGEDCDSSVACKDCEAKERCRKEIEETHGIEISDEKAR